MRRRVTVSGRVQGVFFRDSAREQAERLGVAGWVRNCADGTVQAVFEGDEPAVDAAVAFMGEGLRSARVDGIRVEDEAPEGLRGFAVR